MSREKYDPLRCLPDPDLIRKKLRSTVELAERLKVLLEVAERVANLTRPTPSATEQPTTDTNP